MTVEGDFCIKPEQCYCYVGMCDSLDEYTLSCMGSHCTCCVYNKEEQINNNVNILENEYSLYELDNGFDLEKYEILISKVNSEEEQINNNVGEF